MCKSCSVHYACMTYLLMYDLVLALIRRSSTTTITFRSFQYDSDEACYVHVVDTYNHL